MAQLLVNRRPHHRQALFQPASAFAVATAVLWRFHSWRQPWWQPRGCSLRPSLWTWRHSASSLRRRAGSRGLRLRLRSLNRGLHPRMRVNLSEAEAARRVDCQHPPDQALQIFAAALRKLRRVLELPHFDPLEDFDRGVRAGAVAVVPEGVGAAHHDVEDHPQRPDVDARPLVVHRAVG